MTPREIEVEYEVKVYAIVDLDEGKVVRVEKDVDEIQSTGNTQGVPGGGFTPTEAEQIEAHRIAESDADWPAWD